MPNEQQEYVQFISIKRNSVEGRQSWIAWPTVNEVRKRKIISWSKLNDASQEEQIEIGKEHLLGNFPKHSDKPITKNINSQLDIPPEQFIEEELNGVLTKIKSRKPAGRDEILSEVWKTRKFDDFTSIFQCWI